MCSALQKVQRCKVILESVSKDRSEKRNNPEKIDVEISGEIVGLNEITCPAQWFPQLTSATCERNHNFTVWFFFWRQTCHQEVLIGGLWLNTLNTGGVYLYCAMLVVLENSTSAVTCHNKYSHHG